MESERKSSDILDSIEYTETEVEGLYKCLDFEKDPNLPTVVCITGTSGSGKDAIMNPLVEDGTFVHAVTATSRRRRYKVNDNRAVIVEGRIQKCSNVEDYNSCLEELLKEGLIFNVEPQSSYIWMRWRREGEDDKEYFENLKKEYDLVESDMHYGNVYGLPSSSVETAVSKGVPLVRTDISGIETIREIFRGKYNILVIGVIPDSWTQIESSIRGREASGDIEGVVKKRMEEDRENISRFSKLVNFVLQNTRETVGNTSGLDYSVSVIRKILDLYGVSRG